MHKRYHTLNEHLREVFGEKVIKVSLDAGLSCPNRDGTLGSGGCIFCSEMGSGDFAGQRGLSIKEQFDQVRARTVKKWPRAKYIAYFQSFSATYGPVDYLEKIYREALAVEHVVGISVSTRPDCLNEGILNVLEKLNRETYLWVELGLQSAHDQTLAWMNRGHDFRCFLEGVQKLKQRNIRVCAHMIMGIPIETREDMLQTALTLAKLPIQGVKIHSLHVLRGTKLAELYVQGGLKLLSMDEYIRLVTDILEILPPEMIVHRLMGDGPLNDVIAPEWTRRKWEVLNGIDQEMERRNSQQGINCIP
ncbi:TIGR01212 family radical SAM protein [Dehalobacter sp. DCM]|uniref:TIGR01212 family radical SAM protein n=1 Tax=Dehalobacter sp. DCM TaxID=2907827 RepID=UPI0030815C1E|nr:TIGR01212 family radical SAM protein [Dehalobacter sp. DCM]